MSTGKRAVVLGGALLLFVAGYVVGGILHGDATDYTFRTEEAKKYPLLAKRLFIEEPNDPIINFQPLRNQLNSYFTDNQLAGSLYFEYLPTGTSIRVNGDLEEVAASLMKLPAAMDLYKASEMHKIDIDKKIALQASWLDNNFGNLYQKGAGYELSLREATKIMLEQSDNTALKAVSLSTLNLIRPEENSLHAVDVDLKQNPNLTISIGARSYGSILKCVYFACYLNKADSQELLRYLSQSDFNDRLVAGIADKNITVAHKIGVYKSTDTNAEVQSDCGIVYRINRNYLLCVILKAPDNQTSSDHIATISKLVYEYVTRK